MENELHDVCMEPCASEVHEPIVANNTMFIMTPYPNLVYALDLTQTDGPVK